MPERKLYPLIGVLMGRKKKKEKIQIRKLPLQGDDPLFCPCRPHLRFYSGHYPRPILLYYLLCMQFEIKYPKPE